VPRKVVEGNQLREARQRKAEASSVPARLPSRDGGARRGVRVRRRRPVQADAVDRAVHVPSHLRRRPVVLYRDRVPEPRHPRERHVPSRQRGRVVIPRKWLRRQQRARIRRRPALGLERHQVRFRRLLVQAQPEWRAELRYRRRARKNVLRPSGKRWYVLFIWVAFDSYNSHPIMRPILLRSYI